MYIKKQEVCSACPCFNLMDGCCNLTNSINEKPCDTTLPDCPLPLSTLPESHGDLIDRNQIKYISYVNGDVTVAKDVIMNMPVIVEANNKGDSE